MGDGPANVQAHPAQVGVQEAKDVRGADRERADAEDVAVVRAHEPGRRPGAAHVQGRRADHQAGRRGRRHVLRRERRGGDQHLGRQRQGGGDQPHRQGRVLRGAGPGHAQTEGGVGVLRWRRQVGL